MYVLGITTMTESSAALLHDGKVIAAAEEERFTRVKHAGGFPYHAIRFVLESANLAPADVEHLAVYWNPYKLGFRMRYLLGTLLRNPKLFAERMSRAARVWRGTHVPEGFEAGWAGIFRAGKNFADRFGVAPKQVHFLDHHMCHMASCFYGSSYEESAILVMDGAGEASCTTAGVGRGTHMEKLEEHRLPHSLGHYYAAVTGFLGFRMNDGEYKLMGLSPYGDPAGARWIREHFLRTIGPGRYAVETEVLDYHRALRGSFEGRFKEHFGAPREQSERAEVTDRHRDIAASAQRAFEEVVLDMVRQLRKRTGINRLTIAGGCGLNGTANGKIMTSRIFDEIYVAPVPHDAGGAMGAAMLVYTQLTGKRPDPVNHAQFGPSYSNDQIATALARRSDVQAEKLPGEAVVARAARALAQSQVLAWMQGPMEYGPRALGNRSFLADPRDESVRDSLNEKIKKREPFRPFAPSVKAEKATEYFAITNPSPFMNIVVPVLPEKQGVIPAVTHVDGTARVQTVEKDANARYWALLDEFESHTGVPVLLNTSFNIQEPIVCTPDEALATFVGSKVDALAIGDYWVTHRTNGP